MKKRYLIIMALLLCLISLPSKDVQALTTVSDFENMNILSKSEVTVKDMQNWARKANATDTFINLAPIYVNMAPAHGGVNPAIAYAQAAKETGYGKFTGVLNESFKNPCGLKTPKGGDDKDPEAHTKFNSWEDGVSAHLDHLAIYAGAAGYPRKDTLDPRHFSYIKGNATTVKALGGKWAPSETYGTELASMVQKIYKESISITPEVKSINVDKNSPGLVGDDINITVDSEGKDLSYRFWISDGYKWKIVREYSSSNKYSWTPQKEGNYTIFVDIKSEEFAPNENSSKQIDYKVVSTPKINSIEMDKKDNAMVGDTVSIKANANSPNVLYKFWVSNGLGWELLSDYSTNNTFKWTPKVAGNFKIGVDIKSVNSSKQSDDYKEITYNVGRDGEITAIKTDLISPQDSGKSIKIQAQQQGFKNPVYRFWIKDDLGWKVVREYSSSDTFIWNPNRVGDNSIWVDVKEINSTNDVDHSLEIPYYINPKMKSITADGVRSTGETIKVTQLGKPVKISAEAIGGNNLYEFWISDGITWTMIQSYSTSNTASWTPKKDGFHNIWVEIKANNSSKDYKTTMNVDYIITVPKVNKVIVIDPGHNYGGDDGAYSNFDGISYSERDLNMEVALKVKANLESLGFKVILTRQPGDRSKDSLSESLRKRTEIANNANADFFLSLHHDSGVSSASGISTHYSSYRPTIDNEGVGPGVDPGGWQYDDLQIDYTPSYAAKVSKDLANNLAYGLSGSLGYSNRKAHDHGLYVTRQVNVPSVLLELGFISNREEAIKCANSYEQEKKAKKIAEILYDYFK
ncbi:N-acetylmuramoyl-L-alanine amidase [Clostridium algidicarnis]|uniref:N-acetylmuramoyl-L-alanine amidase n=1 Tax=Clostridium algidicarnis TaxID=37659 RepID=UPI003FD7345F